jgi:hypothetical protein
MNRKNAMYRRSALTCLVLFVLPIGIAEGSARFIRSGTIEPVVADTATGLMWQGCPAGLSGSGCSTGTTNTKQFYPAVQYCKDLNWDGNTDWRLPNIKELSSIVDDKTHNPAIDETAFPNTPNTPFWSSTRAVFYWTEAWYVSFDLGNAGYTLTSGTYSTRCVRLGL